MKKITTPWIILIILLSVFVLCECTDQKEKEKEQIIQIEKKRLKALVDADIVAAATLHANDFQLITPTGYEFDKNEYLGLIETGELDYKIWEFEKISIRLYDKAAVIRYADTDFEVFENGVLSWSGLLIHTNLYEKRNGQWQIVWSQASGENDPNINEENK